MVKVLKCHNFKSQNIIQASREPIAICGYNDNIFVATLSHTIEVFSLKSQSKSPTICFSTESLVQQLHYCFSGNYICTLECKTSRNTKFFSVKVYLNWHLLTGDGPWLTRVRIAGKSRAIVPHDPEDVCLTVIDVPCHGFVRAISTCHESGNMAVAFDNMVQIFCLMEKTIGSTDGTYLDVVVFLELQWDFTIQKLALCEEYVIAASTSEVQVIRVVYSDMATRSRQHSKSSEESFLPTRSTSVDSMRCQRFSGGTSMMTPEISFADSIGPSRFSNMGNRGSMLSSPALSSNTSKSIISTSSIVDDENFVQWKFDESENGPDSYGDSPGFASLLIQVSGARPRPKTISLKGLQDLMSQEPNFAEPPKAKDYRGGAHCTVGEISVLTLLYQRCNLSQDTWEHIQLIPSYLSYNHGLRFEDVVNSVPMHSASFGSLVGMCCFVGGTRAGHVYTLLPQPVKLSTYRYTTDARQVICDSSLLYVVTEIGLETFTARCNVAAIHNMENFNNVTKAFPPMDLETCLCGLQPFIGAREINLAGNHVILLTRVEDSKSASENLWSLYSLEKCSVTEMYKDMIAFGANCQHFGPSTYLHLLQESFMMVRSATVGITDDSLQDLIQESAALLGEFFSTPGCNNWELCLPYYLMSELSVADVVRQVVQFKQHKKKATPYTYGRGLLLYLNHVLFLDEEPFDLKETECDLILDVFFEADRGKLPNLLLFSRMQNYTPEKGMSLLQKYRKEKTALEENSSIEKLARTVIFLRLCDPDSALEALSSLSEKELVEICSSHHQLLHEDLMEFSPLSQLMRRHRPGVLIKSLVSLHDQGTIPMDLSLHLLQGSYDEAQMHRNVQVKDYLEALLDDQSRQYIFEEAASVLCKLYMQRLLNWEPPSTRKLTGPQNFHLPKGNGHFGRRYSWLDHIFPFLGPRSMWQPCLHLVTASPTSVCRMGHSKSCPPTEQHSTVICSCFLCNEDLIRFQSLLSSNFTSTSLAKTTFTLLQDNKNFNGIESMTLLCLLHIDLGKCIRRVVEMYPSILPDFVASVIGNDYEKWKQLLTCFMARLRQEAQNPSDMEMVYSTAFRGVLMELCGLVTATEFLKLLPDDGNLIFFLPFIEISFKKQQSRKLKKQIVCKGEELRQVT